MTSVLGSLARPGIGVSMDISVPAPPWLQTGEPLACMESDPELFFPYTYGLACEDQIEEARALCRACPVRDLCLDWALPQADLDGIWAATTPAERRRMRNKERKTA